MRPAETTLNIGVTLLRAASFELRATRVARSSRLVARSYRDSRLVPPDRAAQFSRVQLDEGLIDHVPRKYLAPAMSDHGLNVFLKNLGELAGSVFSFRQPFWILTVPDQRVSANLHAVPGREIHNLVGLRKIIRLPLRMHHLPLERVFPFQHIELAGERGRVGRFGKCRRPPPRPDRHSRRR